MEFEPHVFRSAAQPARDASLSSGGRWRRVLPSWGVALSVGVHGALAATLLVRPEMMGTAQQRSEASSSSRVITLVIDSLVDDEAAPNDAASGASAAVPVTATASSAPAPTPSEETRPEAALDEVMPINAAQADITAAARETPKPVGPEVHVPQEQKPLDGPAVQAPPEASSVLAVIAGPLS